MSKLTTCTVLFVGAAMAAAVPVTNRVRDGRPSAAHSVAVAQQQLSDSAFAKLISRFSEPAGFFDTDNLISNESNYLHPVPRMNSMGVRGGAYIGVGPDQNYSYIAHVRPEIAFMVDIRRDAGLQHLLYKQLMAEARNRMEYLCLLFGKPVPANLESWNSRGPQEITTHLDNVPGQRPLFDSTVARVRRRIAAMSHRVSEQELQAIARFQEEFFRAGLGLQFTTFNRQPNSNYPTLRSLILERDAAGKQVSYLASEDLFQVVKMLHAQNLIVPVTGNLAGRHSLREIGVYLGERRLVVSAIYVSNVEFYLWRERTFDSFAANVRTLPRNERSVIIRSYFNNGGYFIAPAGRSGNTLSAQLLQTMDSFVKEYDAGRYVTYTDLVTRSIIPPL